MSWILFGLDQHAFGDPLVDSETHIQWLWWYFSTHLIFLLSWYQSWMLRVALFHLVLVNIMSPIVCSCIVFYYMSYHHRFVLYLLDKLTCVLKCFFVSRIDEFGCKLYLLVMDRNWPQRNKGNQLQLNVINNFINSTLYDVEGNGTWVNILAATFLMCYGTAI